MKYEIRSWYKHWFKGHRMRMVNGVLDYYDNGMWYMAFNQEWWLKPYLRG